jgi:phage-related protein
VRDRLGKALFLLQMGEKPGMPLARPMPSVAPGVFEVRLHGADGQYRTFCFTASARGILVLHAFVKKMRQTPPAEILLARKRWKELSEAIRKINSTRYLLRLAKDLKLMSLDSWSFAVEHVDEIGRVAGLAGMHH